MSMNPSYINVCSQLNGICGHKTYICSCASTYLQPQERDFTIFSLLPPELRFQVWEQAMSTSRIIWLTGPGFDPPVPKQTMVIDNKSYRAAPRLFFVNQEARRIALGFYNLRITVTRPLPPLPPGVFRPADQKPNSGEYHYLMSECDTIGISGAHIGGLMSCELSSSANRVRKVLFTGNIPNHAAFQSFRAWPRSSDDEDVEQNEHNACILSEVLQLCNWLQKFLGVSRTLLRIYNALPPYSPIPLGLQKYSPNRCEYGPAGEYLDEFRPCPQLASMVDAAEGHHTSLGSNRVREILSKRQPILARDCPLIIPGHMATTEPEEGMLPPRTFWAELERFEDIAKQTTILPKPKNGHHVAFVPIGNEVKRIGRLFSNSSL